MSRMSRAEVPDTRCSRLVSLVRIAGVSALLAACAGDMKLLARPPFDGGVELAEAPLPFGVVLGTADCTVDGKPDAVEAYALKQQLLRDLRQAHVFRDAGDSRGALGGPAAAATVEVKVVVEPYGVFNSIKWHVSFLTLGLLSPLLPIHRGLESRLRCTLQLPDGTALTYEQTVAASAKSHVIPFVDGRDLVREMLTASGSVLTGGVVRQIQEDPELDSWREP